jgi:hypothetical protein
VSRLCEDLPPIASDDELLEWSRQLTLRPIRPNRPLVAVRSTSRLSTEELFAEIAERASFVHDRP